MARDDLKVNAFSQSVVAPPYNLSLDYSTLAFYNYFRDDTTTYKHGQHHPRDYLSNFGQFDTNQGVEYYQEIKTFQNLVPDAKDDQAHKIIKEEQAIEVLTVFLAKPSLKNMIRESLIRPLEVLY